MTLAREMLKGEERGSFIDREAALRRVKAASPLIPTHSHQASDMDQSTLNELLQISHSYYEILFETFVMLISVIIQEVSYNTIRL